LESKRKGPPYQSLKGKETLEVVIQTRTLWTSKGTGTRPKERGKNGECKYFEGEKRRTGRKEEWVTASFLALGLQRHEGMSDRKGSGEGFILSEKEM